SASTPRRSTARPSSSGSEIVGTLRSGGLALKNFGFVCAATFVIGSLHCSPGVDNHGTGGGAATGGGGTGGGATGGGTGGGAGWTWQNPLPQGNALNGVWASSANDVWAVGVYGTAMHWEGSAWSLSSTGTTTDLWAVWGAASNDVWAVGDN